MTSLLVMNTLVSNTPNSFSINFEVMYNADL